MSLRRSTVSAPVQFGLFPLVVTGVQRLSQHYVRVSLAGESLRRAAAGISDGEGQVLDSYIKLLIPPAGQKEPVDVELTDGWYRDYLLVDPQKRGWIRTYTVRDSRLVDGRRLPVIPGTFRAGEGTELSPFEHSLPRQFVPEVDIDFVLHTDSSGMMGPGAAWAAGVREGDFISFLAPLKGSSLWSSWNPGTAQRMIVLADETAVPAALSIARTFTPQTCAHLLLEVPETADVLDQSSLGSPGLADCPQVQLRWLARNRDGGNSGHGEMLYRELRDLLGLPQAEGLPAAEPVAADEIVWGLAEEEHELYVFIAGESGTIKTLRRICVNEAGIDRRNISFMGYWKKGRAEN